MTHRLHQFAGHAREGEQAGHVVLFLHLDERPDDLVHVAARAEITAFAGEDDRLDVGCKFEAAKQSPEFAVALEGQRVLAFGTIERDRRDLARHLPLEMRRLVVGRLEFLHARLLSTSENQNMVRPPETLSVWPVT